MQRTALLIIFVIFLTLTPRADADEIVINAVGDIMLAGRWASTIKKKGYDYPFAATRAELAKGDINLANLESPLGRKGTEFTEKQFRFRAEPEVATALRSAGFNLVTLANNHSMDFGPVALTETFHNLETAGIRWIGAGSDLDAARKNVIMSVKGKRVAFLGYSKTLPAEFHATARRPGTAPGHDALVLADIAAARKEADYVIVSFHWGAEGSRTPHAYQQALAHKVIDAGADAVIGHHPHVLQGIERYKRGIIFYSLGNFSFASASRTASSALIRLRLSQTRRSAEIVPLDILYRRVQFQPQVLSGTKAAAIVADLNRLSRPFKTEIQTIDGTYHVSF